MNKRGVTLVELLISVALISIIMIFLFQLLSDLNYQYENDYIASTYQDQRLEIINTLESKLLSSSDIKSVSTASNYIYFKDENENNIYILKSEEHKLSFFLENESNIIRVWNYENASFSTSPSCKTSSSGDFSIAFCKIEVYTDNVNNKVYYDSTLNKYTDNNNSLDDIEISIYYDKEDSE